jgi:hypothetical protein
MNDPLIKQTESPVALLQIVCGSRAIADPVSVDLEDRAFSVLTIARLENEGGLTFNQQSDEPATKEV